MATIVECLPGSSITCSFVVFIPEFQGPGLADYTVGGRRSLFGRSGGQMLPLQWRGLERSAREVITFRKVYTTIGSHSTSPVSIDLLRI